MPAAERMLLEVTGGGGRMRPCLHRVPCSLRCSVLPHHRLGLAGCRCMVTCQVRAGWLKSGPPGRLAAAYLGLHCMGQHHRVRQRGEQGAHDARMTSHAHRHQRCERLQVTPAASHNQHTRLAAAPNMLGHRAGAAARQGSMYAGCRLPRGSVGDVALASGLPSARQAAGPALMSRSVNMASSLFTHCSWPLRQAA